MTLASEISVLETEITQLRSENSIQRQHIGILEFENDQLRQVNTRISNERDVYLRRSEAIKALLDQTGALLVNSIRTFHESERELEKTGEETKRLEKVSDHRKA